MSNLKTFLYDPSKMDPTTFQKFYVRALEQDGEPWFVAKDVCDVLGLKDFKTSMRNLDEDEKGSILCPPLEDPSGCPSSTNPDSTV